MCSLVLASCSFIPSNDIKADMSYSGKSVVLSQFGTLTVTLESDIYSGSVWLEKSNVRDGLVLELNDHKYIAAESSAPGTTGSDIWILDGSNPGTTSISLQYRAPDSDAIIYKTFNLTVRVVGKG
jgi:predicted secreted protein